jgi:hypothetical protein
MPEYWFVVKPGNGDLYDALSTAVAGRPGYHVINERRSAHAVPPGRERRTCRVWEGEEMLIAERSDDVAG